jgi:imidazolonepropionase-like amidohydrolase
MTTVLYPYRFLDVRQGRYIYDHYIVISNNQINKITKSENDNVIDLSNITLLPGFIDTHVHITYHFPDEKEGLKSNCYKTLRAGFTTVRDLGVSGSITPLKKFIESSNIQPRILTSGVPIFAKDVKLNSLERLLEQRYDSDVIKVFEKDNSITSNELKRLVTLTNKPVAVHASTSQEISNAIFSNCSTIEHCTYINDSNISQLLNTKIRICPTLYLPTNYLNNWPKYEFMFGNNVKDAHDHFVKMEKHCIPNLTKAYNRGAKFVFGTDAVAGYHGNNYMEFERMLQLGMSPLEVIQSATIDSAEVISQGPHGIHNLGEILPNFKADIVGVKGDPLRDLNCLKAISFVMKDGIIFFQ